MAAAFARAHLHECLASVALQWRWHWHSRRATDMLVTPSPAPSPAKVGWHGLPSSISKFTCHFATVGGRGRNGWGMGCGCRIQVQPSAQWSCIACGTLERVPVCPYLNDGCNNRCLLVLQQLLKLYYDCAGGHCSCKGVSNQEQHAAPGADPVGRAQRG
jgi:hypothetical protein